MASVRRKRGSKYWFACFTQADASRTQRSTKETDRKKAQKLADTFEEAAHRRATARQAQRIIADVYRRATGDALPSLSICTYSESWLNRKKAETARSTLTFYTGKTRRFLKWLGERSERDLVTISSADILAFRSSEAERVNPGTVNHGIKLLRMVFEDAKREGHLADNPADAVKLVKRNGQRSRRPFKMPEIRRLLAVANDEWRSLIMFGLYTGQRLGDLARLTWGSIDLRRGTIHLVTSKTGRHQIIPLARPLRRHIKKLSTHAKAAHPVHPAAFKSVQKSEKVGTLSRQFYELMAKAGLVPVKKHRTGINDAGRNGHREISEISFHSLRHTATSLMKNAGVSVAIVQDIIGHESAAISANYTHIDEASKRSALSAMPDVTMRA